MDIDYPKSSEKLLMINKIIQIILKNNIQVKEEHLNIFCEQEITGYSLLITTEEKFKSYGLKEEPAMILVDFARKCKEESSIPQFTPHSSSEVELDNALMN
ncbi:hypothetical protein GLOIN_2v1476258 [Rhizophagus clarus]|uniref:Uncharacterized protein n=1 Tax=Rhizophagus clarus TaxID=94130 RepID=A0A8H3QB80_9GLOM|nr:hypothetical protein GLOIN_2v1476258 [Rhizophagus clarus]